MQTIATIGLDIAKSVFQVHGVDAGGQAVIRRQLKRRYVLTFFQKLTPCLVGIVIRPAILALTHFWCSFPCFAGVALSVIQRIGGITGDVP